MFLTSCIRGGSKDRRPGWIITFEFSDDAVLALKRAIPYFGADGPNREWRPDKKEWWVSEKYQHVLKGLFSNFETLITQQGRLPL